MKPALLIAILAVSINGFSQDFPTASIMPHPSPMSMKDGRPGAGEPGDHYSGTLAGRNFGEMSKPHTPEDRSFIQLNDSIYVWHWDTLIAGWTIATKIVNITYDVNNNLIRKVYQNWNGSVWVNYSYVMYTYDSNNNQISCLSQYWDESGWVNDFQKKSTYDSNNNQTGYLTQNWDESVWVNSYQASYTYDSNNNQTGSLGQEWDGGNWVNSYQVSYTYDSNNNQTGYIGQDWQGNDWVNWAKETHTYDSNNNQTSNLQQHWGASSWFNLYLNTYTYDSSNNQTSNLFQQWNTSAWVDPYLYTYTYDSNNNLTSSLLQYWNDSAWVAMKLGNRFYDENNFLQNETTKYFDAFGAIVNIPLPWWPFIMYSDSTRYFFAAVSGINDLKSDDDNVSVFPNPSNGEFTINSKNSIGALEIYNLQGDRIYANPKFNQQTSCDIDLLGQGKGLYIIKIFDGKKFSTMKVVVQ